jgi:hypothetical protein
MAFLAFDHTVSVRHIIDPKASADSGAEVALLWWANKTVGEEQWRLQAQAAKGCGSIDNEPKRAEQNG